MLQARGRMTAAQLAAELEVSQRTVLRDIEALSAAGIPVYAIRGCAGGFELLDGYRSDLSVRQRPGGDRAAPAAATAERARVRLSPRGRRLAALLGRPSDSGSADRSPCRARGLGRGLGPDRLGRRRGARHACSRTRGRGDPPAGAARSGPADGQANSGAALQPGRSPRDAGTPIILKACPCIRGTGLQDHGEAPCRERLTAPSARGCSGGRGRPGRSPAAEQVAQRLGVAVECLPAAVSEGRRGFRRGPVFRFSLAR